MIIIPIFNIGELLYNNISKFFVKVDNKFLIEHCLESLDLEGHELIFIISEKDAFNYKIDKILRELYEDLPIGLEKFLTWMKEDPSIYLAILEAQQWVEKQSWSPETKQCRKCGEVLKSESFGKTQKYKDGLQKICKLCVKNPSEKLSKIQEKQKKLQELKNKLDN